MTNPNPMAGCLKLDLGAGEKSPPGFIPYGARFGTPIYPLPYFPDTVDEIRCSHTLEHFPAKDVPAVLASWVGTLKPGGILKIAVPDFTKIARGYLAGAGIPVQQFIMGGQKDENDFHKVVFDRELLAQLLTDAGLVLLTEWKSELKDDAASLEISLNLMGRKPGPKPTIRGVITRPRLGFNEFWDCALLALPKLGVEMTSVGGAFWNQSLEQAIDYALEIKPEYVLVMDYDSVFTVEHIERLQELARVYSHADAIAPLQSSRHGEIPLFGLSKNTPVVGREGDTLLIDAAHFDCDIVEMPQAHFGLTLIKADAIRALPRPLFQGVPDAEGKWGKDRVDPDIYFWR